MSLTSPRAAFPSCRSLLVLALAAMPLGAQSLTRLVPADAYSLMSAVHDPDMKFVEDAGAKVWKAVQDARLHQPFLKLLEINSASGDDVEQARGLIDYLSRLVGDVAWADLVANESVYAEIPEPALPGLPPGVFSYLLACRPDRDKVPELERSLTALLKGAEELIGDLRYEASVRPGDPNTRVHSLMAGHLPMAQFAVRGDVILMGFGSSAFARSLDLLEGNGGEALVDTPRYRTAVGEVTAGSSQFMYMDVERLINAIFDQVTPYALSHAGGDEAWLIRQGLDDVRGLLDFVDTSVTAVHAEGNTLVSECWTRFDPVATATGNPLYDAFCRPAAVNDLLDYVPADALSVQVHGGVDLRPLYGWVRERSTSYAPEAADILIAWDGIQAALDMSLENDVLSWLGSESMSVTMPARRGAGEDWVHIARLRDADGARKFFSRLDSVYKAVVPPLLKRLENDLGQSPVIPHIAIAPAGGRFPAMQRLSISLKVPRSPFPLPPIPDILCGIMGNQLIITTSEDALMHVMDVAAGKAEGLWEHPAMDEGRLPRGDVTAFGYLPVGRQLAEVSQAVTVGGSMMQLMISQMGQGDPGASQVAELVADLLPRVSSILQSVDFLDDEASYSESRKNGLVDYRRTTTRYRDN